MILEPVQDEEKSRFYLEEQEQETKRKQEIKLLQFRILDEENWRIFKEGQKTHIIRMNDIPWPSGSGKISKYYLS
jgi:hypothetical protein